MKERTFVEDGHRPTIPSIRKKYANGEYDHSVEPSISVLLGTIESLYELAQEQQAMIEEALAGWKNEKDKNGVINDE